ncbi:maleylacetate reductase [Solicola sp. PLA-1-18]|uniref:maleylacetate reductase n=1 Tax=Solicola sp. PLA-1-18 TaxID=3380532 RepID=UPI003B7D6090
MAHTPAPLRFEHDALAQRIVLAPGAARESLGREIAAVGGTRVLLVVSEAEADLGARLTADLGPDVTVVATFTGVRPHVPVEVAEAARELARSSGADVVVPVGGGSTTGTAKAVTLTEHLPIVAVPTTYAGSEATPVWGLTEHHRKTTGTDPVVLPRTIVYDPELTMTLPVGLSVSSGLNALAHCVDSLWAPKADPINAAIATEGIRALAAGLPAVVADAGDVEARDRCLYGAYLSAASFASAGSGLHHKICHVLGGAHDLPHADTHAVVLPHVLAFNAAAAPEAARRIAEALGADDALDGLLALTRGLGAPDNLRDLGMPEDAIATDAQAVVDAAPPSNPRPVRAEDVERLLRTAWAGQAPTADIEERR